VVGDSTIEVAATPRHAGQPAQRRAQLVRIVLYAVVANLVRQVSGSVDPRAAGRCVTAATAVRTALYARPDAPAAADHHPMERPLDPARLGDHLDRLYRAAWALCGSREDAEDLVQETYARVLARPRLLRHEDDLGYLLRALRNTFLNQKRTERRRLRPGPLPDQLDLVPDPQARDPQAALEAGELYAAVAALPADFRDVLVAVDVTGLSYKEAARALRIREGTVMSRLYRARQQVVGHIEGGSA
jgi:RNA polymerase sigma-70 factor, ECF subfamily